MALVSTLDFCLADRIVFLGSGRNWISHLIELATGIHAAKFLNSDGSHIVIMDHFFDKYIKRDTKMKKNIHGLQLDIAEPLIPITGTNNIRAALSR